MKRSGQKSAKGSPGERCETTEGRICETGREEKREEFLDKQSGISKKEEVMGEEIGEQEMEE